MKTSGDQSSASEKPPPSWTEPLEPLLVTSSPRAVVRFLHDVVLMTDSEIADAIGVQSDVTIRRWRSEDASGTPRHPERIDDLRAIVGMLLNSRLVYPEEVGQFLRARNEHLGYRRPIDLLARCEFGRVMEAADRVITQLARHRDARFEGVVAGEHTLPSGMTYAASTPAAPDSLGPPACPFDSSSET